MTNDTPKYFIAVTRNKSIVPQKEAVILAEAISKMTHRFEEIEVMTRRKKVFRGQNMSRQQTEHTTGTGLYKEFMNVSLKDKGTPKSNTVNFSQYFKHSYAS